MIRLGDIVRIKECDYKHDHPEVTEYWAGSICVVSLAYYTFYKLEFIEEVANFPQRPKNVDNISKYVWKEDELELLFNA